MLSGCLVDVQYEDDVSTELPYNVQLYRARSPADTGQGWVLGPPGCAASATVLRASVLYEGATGPACGSEPKDTLSTSSNPHAQSLITGASGATGTARQIQLPCAKSIRIPPYARSK